MMAPMRQRRSTPPTVLQTMGVIGTREDVGEDDELAVTDCVDADVAVPDGR
jgi:hypothetical protein